MSNETVEPELMTLNAAEREGYIAHGCDPACHVCGESIGVGDEYGMQTFVAEDELFTITGGVIRANIRGMTCKRCVEEKRDWPESERKKMMDRLKRVLPPPQRKEVAEPEPERQVGRGCFVLDDGTRF